MSVDGATQASLDHAVALAEDGGMTVVRPNPNELLLDLDDEASLSRYAVMFLALGENFGAWEKERWRSKSGVGWHVVVGLGVDLDASQRIALQAALGSDPLRELLGIACIRNGVSDPSVLFRPGATQGGSR